MAKKKEGKINKEFEKVSLGDARLNKRLIHTVNELNAMPAGCINAASEDWKSKKAAYRFFDNDKSSVDKILSTHFDRTKKRMNNCKYVYSIQDTSFVNFNKHKKTTGLGSIGKYPNHEHHVQGLIMHVSLAVSDSGLPLGLQSFDVWARPEKGYDKEVEREEKESSKWINHLARAKNLYQGDSKMILLGDRESDYFELFDKVKEHKVDAVIRSKHDRNIKGEDIAIERRLERTEPCGEILIDKIRTKKNGYRSAKLEIKYSQIKIEVPGNCQSRYPFGLELYVVEAREIDPPKSEEGLYWRLLTTMDVDCLDDAIEIVAHYKKRWNVESFFKVLKSGCKIEDCRLETAERLKKYIAVMSVIAWRIYWMVHVSRVAPKLPWSSVLTHIEYQTLFISINKKEIMEGKMSKKPPENKQWSTQECVRSIAMLGGFNGRKGDGEPGMVSVWRGWMRLQDMVEISEAFL